MAAENPNAEVTLLRLDEVKSRCALGKSLIYELMARGRFPGPVYISPKAPRWRSDQLDAWIESLPADRAAA